MAVLSHIITIFVLFAALQTGLAAPPCKSKYSPSVDTPSVDTPAVAPGKDAPAPTQTVPPTSVAATDNDNSGTQSVQDRYLKSHNDFRAKYNAAALLWSDTLAGQAESWASNCKFEHSHVAGLGENLALATGDLTPENAVKMWTDESTDHIAGVADHFSQVVWKATTHVGCASHVCDHITIDGNDWGKSTLVVCNYSPPGNVVGQHSENVQLPA